MAGERNYIRVPPDSTGKRVLINHSAQLFYKNLNPTSYAWVTDSDLYQTTFSDNSLHSFHLHEASALTPNTGILYVSYDEISERDSLTPVIDTIIYDIDGTTPIAAVSSSIDVFVNTTNIVGFADPTHGVDVDSTGSMNVRFSEGKPQLDAFGKLRVSDATLLGAYTFYSEQDLTKWTTSTSHNDDTNFIIHNTTTKSADLVADGLNNSYVEMSSNTYHHYFPGSSQLAMMTLALSHSSLTNNTMRWGYFDAVDGYGFYRSGSDFGVFVRNSCSGGPDIEILQSDWNGDKIDGTGDSGFNIDLTLDNLYWMDVQWLGAGRIRFGIYHNGERVVCHSHQHNNTLPYPVTASGTLPITVSNVNIGASGFTSTFKLFCTAVYTELGIPDVTIYGVPKLYHTMVTIPSATLEEVPIHLATMSPLNALTGSGNHTIYWPQDIGVSAYDAVTGNDVRIRLDMFAEPIVSGLAFDNVAEVDNTVRASTAGTVHGGGQLISKNVIQGTTSIPVDRIYNSINQSSIKNYALNGGWRRRNFATVTAGASTTEVTFTDGYVQFKEEFPISLMGVEVNGVNSAINSGPISNYNTYLKITGVNSAELWADADFTVPKTLEAGTVTDTGHCHAYYGAPFYWSVVVSRVGPNISGNDYVVHFNLDWKELRR